MIMEYILDTWVVETTLALVTGICLIGLVWLHFHPEQDEQR